MYVENYEWHNSLIEQLENLCSTYSIGEIVKYRGLYYTIINKGFFDRYDLKLHEIHNEEFDDDPETYVFKMYYSGVPASSLESVVQ